MKNKLFLFIVLLATHLLALATQQQFVIGVWVPPAMTGVVSDDNAHLLTLKNMGVNTIVGLNAQDKDGNYFNPSESYRTYSDNTNHSPRYYLERLQDVGGLRILVDDTRFWVMEWVTKNGTTGPSWNATLLTNTQAQSIVNDYNNIIGIPNGRNISNDIVMGYSLKDEPYSSITLNGVVFNELTSRVVPSMQLLNTLDPNRVVYANLNPYFGLFSNFNTDYAGYVQSYYNSGATTIASFDYYPFSSNGSWNAYGIPSGTYYFRNLQLFAQEASSRNMNFWFYPLSTSSGGYADITNTNLRFMAHAPILYGAKGIVYFTYALFVDGTQYRNAMIDHAFGITNTYTWAQTINARINKMGPTLLSLQWRETIHASPNPPTSNEPVNTTNTTGVIQPLGISNTNFAVGIFKGKDGKDYLIVMNLDRIAAQSVTISCVKAVLAKRHLQTSDTWELLPGGSRFLLSNIQPAGIELIRLDPFPIRKSLLLD